MISRSVRPLARSCTGVVLAGGASERFDGRAKGLLEVGGVRIIDRVLVALRGATERQIVVTKRGAPRIEYELDVPVQADLRPERGSLIGLHTALSAAGGPVLVVAWDMPFVPRQLLIALRELGERRGSAAVPEGAGGLEPLCAYYPYASLDVIERQLARGELRLGALLDVLPARAILTRGDVARFGNPAFLFSNVNCPADLEAAERWLARADQAGPMDSESSIEPAGT
jgi:molybdopterin-guanine dinucleotide biosynthesis protein A